MHFAVFGLLHNPNRLLTRVADLLLGALDRDVEDTASDEESRDEPGNHC